MRQDMMRVLVTGGAGFIGSHTVDVLLERGYEVRVYDSLEPPTHANGVPPAYLAREAEFVHADVRDRNALARALRGVDAVLHLAATGGFTPAIGSYFSANTIGTATLWEVIRDERLPIQKVVVASSVAVYGEGKYRCSAHGAVHPRPRSIAQLERHDWEVRCSQCDEQVVPIPTDEETPVEPGTAYAISKFDQERITLSYGRQLGVRVTALRYFLTYGPRQSIHNPYTGVCSIFANRIRNELPAVIYEDGYQTRDFVYVRDTARANVLSLESAHADAGVFNVGTGQATTMRALATALHEELGAALRLEIPQRFRPGDVRHIVADVHQLQRVGFEPQFTLRQGLRQYVAWVGQQEPLPDVFGAAEQGLREAGIVRSIS